MGLLDVAGADLRAILGDTSLFALPITITDPDGKTAVVNGQQRDISLSIDPSTGAKIAARTASVALSVLDVEAAFGCLPNAVLEESEGKWLVSFTAPTGGLRQYAVTERLPDTLGCVVLILEDYG
jgi:hypothetical protein